VRSETLDREWTRTTIDSATLAARLRLPGSDRDWQLVEQRYGPLVELFARGVGLSAAAAEDVRQESLAALVQAVRGAQFEQARGRLRDYLFGIARNKVCDALARERRAREVPLEGAGGCADVPGDDELAAGWKREEQAAVAAQCLREARDHFQDETYAIYYQRVVEDRSSAEVAQRLNKTVRAVDMATFHVREFLRTIHPQIEEIF
jgi:RNA polymerase sigma factor (sigma-70 family)